YSHPRTFHLVIRLSAFHIRWLLCDFQPLISNLQSASCFLLLTLPSVFRPPSSVLYSPSAIRYLPSATCNANSTNVRVGVPFPHLLIYPRSRPSPIPADPAISRCAHFAPFSTKLRMNHAPVIAPAARPPLFFKSAQSLRIANKYSSSIGIRQFFSPVRSPISYNVSASSSSLEKTPVRYDPSATTIAPVNVAASSTGFNFKSRVA